MRFPVTRRPYQVEFWLARDYGGSPTIKTVEVNDTGAGNNPQQFTFDVKVSLQRTWDGTTLL